MGDRHRFRADWFDYTAGTYFVTICSYEHQNTFGSIRHNIFYPTELGKIIRDCINKIAQTHPNADVINYVVMPNHIHLVISVDTAPIPLSQKQVTLSTTLHTRYMGQKSTSHSNGCLRAPKHGEMTDFDHHNSKLALIIGSFKAAVTRIARKKGLITLRCWQPRFHDHIIRNQRAYNKIMNYVDSNVYLWEKDCFY